MFIIRVPTVTQNSTESKPESKNLVRRIGTQLANWAPRHAQVRAQWPYRGPWPGHVAARAGRVAATVPLTPRLQHAPAAHPAHAYRAPYARLRSAAPRTRAHLLVRSRLRPAPLRQRLLAQHAHSLTRSTYRAPSAVSWPPSRPYRRAQRRVAARP